MDTSASANSIFSVGRTIEKCKQMIQSVLLHQQAFYEPCSAERIKKITEDLKDEKVLYIFFSLFLLHALLN